MLWENVILRNGSIISFYKQERHAECGPACVDIVLRLTGKPVGMAQLRDYARMMDHEKFGLPRSQDWHTAGVNFLSTISTLKTFSRKYIVGRKLGEREFKAFCETRSQQNPAIILVKWKNGLWHSLVTVGKNTRPEQDTIEILDPDNGYQEERMDQFPFYNPVDADRRPINSGGTLWNGYVLQIGV